MNVSVVICTYSDNLYDDFCEAVESVLDQTYNDREVVVVVDGNQTYYDRIQDKYGHRDDVTITCNEENKGLLESRNRGAKIADGDVVAFIDDDAVADPNWLELLVNAYETKNVVAAGGRMTPIWIAERPSFLPEEFYWLVGVTHSGFADGPGEVRNTFGSNISFRRDIFLELGGFDTEIGGRKGDKNLQGGETELCARMERKYGQKVWYVPDATVGHKVFDYRTALPWLVKRAFWQGYSKRVMERLVPQSSGDEAAFLKRLLFQRLPNRVAQLITAPSKEDTIELGSILVFTFAVGAGYWYAIMKNIFRDYS